VAPGEFVAFVGRSAAANPLSLIRRAMDFPTSGEVVLDGISINSCDDAVPHKLRREKVGLRFPIFFS